MEAYLVTTSFGGASKKRFYLDHNVERFLRFVSMDLSFGADSFWSFAHLVRLFLTELLVRYRILFSSVSAFASITLPKTVAFARKKISIIDSPPTPRLTSELLPSLIEVSSDSYWEQSHISHDSHNKK
jgi:hypothetical protein